MTLANKSSSQQFITVLNEFVKEFSVQTLSAIIFKGLKATKKVNEINFLNQTLESITPNQSQNVIESKSLSLVDIHLDCLMSICQFLSITDLSNLEICNRFLFKFLRHTPAAIYSLDAPTWFIHNFGKKYNKMDTNRYCNVKQLSLQKMNNIKQHNVYDFVTKVSLTPIKLSLHSMSFYDLYPFCLESLEYLQLTGLALDQIIATLPSSSQISLQKLHLSIYCSTTDYGQFAGLLQRLFTFKSIASLIIDFNSVLFQDGDVKKILQEHHDCDFWRNLREFCFEHKSRPMDQSYLLNMY